jgi:hypothetical protein
MTVLAAVRPDDWNLPLFLHILGAMTLVGALVLVAVSLVGARGSDGAASLRLGYRSLLLAALPAWIVMRAAAEWTASKEGWSGVDSPPSWIDMGYMISEPTFLLLIIATILTAIAARRAARADGAKTTTLSNVAVALVAITLIAYVVAIWAMTAKPV